MNPIFLGPHSSSEESRLAAGDASPRSSARGLLVALALAGLPLAGSAEEWYVDADAASCAAGNGSAATPFCTIGEAIQAAGSGDTILVAAGEYREVLRIDEDLTLVGIEGEAVTTLEALLFVEDAVTVENGAAVSIQGLTIHGSFGSGIRVESALPPSVLAITNTTISSNSSGAIHNTNGRVTVTSSTLTNNLARFGGGIYNRSGEVRVADSLLVRNRSIANPTSEGGGIHSSGLLVVERSRLDDNFAYSYNNSFGKARGGALFNGAGGIAVLQNSSLDGNYCEIDTYPFGGYGATGGAIMNEGDLLVQNCLIAQSRCYPSYYADARVIDSRFGTLVLESSTVAGTYRSFESPTAVRASSGSVVASTIVWGNASPLFPESQVQGSSGLPRVHHSDVQGGWGGPGSANLSVAPGFTDPDGEDWTLRATSPLIDGGDPDSGLLGLDLAGGSRLNDGDLDRSLVLDMGAYEHSHVELDVTGDATPGGELTLDVTGRAGMDLLLAIGPPEPSGAGLRRDPLGILFFDLGAPVKVVSLGTIPTSVKLTIPPTVPVPVSVVMQLLGLEPVRRGGGKRPANVSNPVFVTVQ